MAAPRGACFQRRHPVAAGVICAVRALPV